MSGWTDEELQAAVDAYLWMREQEHAGARFVKKDVYRDLAERYGRTIGAWDYRMQNISSVLEDIGEPIISGLMPAKNVGPTASGKLIRMIRDRDAGQEGRAYKYGEKRTWELALDALQALGGAATLREVTQHALERSPDLKARNVGADLSLLSVNSPARTSYHGNHKPRRTDGGASYDRLFKVGQGRNAVYEPYLPEVHGVWEIYPDPSAGNQRGLSVRQVADPASIGVSKAEDEADSAGTFEPESIIDARDRVYSSIVRRRGQSEFRKALLAAYGGRCAVTGSDVIEILEAAHVHPYRGAATNVTANGLLLRADIHTLFDLYLISIDPPTRTVCISPKLARTMCAELRGVTLRNPGGSQHIVSHSALEWHRAQCHW
ncbi:HNH endonuclease [Stenotrophomonas panacihumi]|uniref:HNH endonuclease n=1 Tax=Stenotrophomonas panacihumi TaxID=676599 RepID=UPI0013795666|nr:HNH endonuclease signature motif containing protein [Stenotrophomonas panacihumi]